MPIQHLTQSFITNIAALPGKDRTEWCDKSHPGLYVEARKTSPSRGTYYLRYKDSGGITRHLKLGSTTDLSLAEARATAKEKLAEIRLGADPSAERKQKRAIPTLRVFWEEQYLPYIKSRKRSWPGDENRMQARLLPRWGDRQLDSITKKELVEFHLELKAEGLAGATCDHCIKQLRALFNTAISWEVISVNPAARIKLFNEPNQVDHQLTDEQLKVLLTTLATHEQKLVCRICMFLLSTGARLSEALWADWEQFDRERRLWTIPAANSKSKRLRSVPLNESALQVLTDLAPKGHAGPLFINPRTGQRLMTVHKAWGKIRTAAGLPHLRIHDLRHLHASFLVNAGHTLYEVQQLLGHSSPLVTQRYAHLNQRTLHTASNSVATRLAAATPRLLPAPDTPGPTTAP